MGMNGRHTHTHTRQQRTVMEATWIKRRKNHEYLRTLNDKRAGTVNARKKQLNWAASASFLPTAQCCAPCRWWSNRNGGNEARKRRGRDRSVHRLPVIKTKSKRYVTKNTSLVRKHVIANTLELAAQFCVRSQCWSIRDQYSDTQKRRLHLGELGNCLV